MCGALVGEDAEWCGQCYTDLRAPVEAGAEAVGLPVITELSDGATEGAARTNGGARADGAVSTDAPRVAWPCGACGRRNAMELDVCLACGTPFGHSFEPPSERTQISPGAATRWSLVYPGLGHFRAGAGIEGLSRAVVFTWALATGITFVSLGPSGGLGAIGVLGVASLLCAAVLYALTAMDAGRSAAGYPPLVSSRRLLWVAAGLVLFSVASAALITATGLSNAGGGG
jgi:hypothetical protein